MELLELKAEDFKRCLEEFKPRIGKYDWMWKLMRKRSLPAYGFPAKTWEILKKFGNPRRPYFVAETGHGISFLGDYRDRYSAMCAFDPDFDKTTLDFIQEQMQQSDGALLDIGANQGIITATMAKFLQGRSEVLAFEPIPETAHRAAAAFALNNLTNVRLFVIAVGDIDGEIPFYDAPGVSEGASANPTDHGELITWRKTTAFCRRLDSLMNEGALPRTAFLKIDAEGNEFKVIDGARELLRRDGPALFFEYFPHVARSSGWAIPQIEAAISAASPYHFHVLRSHATQRKPVMMPFPPDPGSDEIVDIYCESAG